MFRLRLFSSTAVFLFVASGVLYATQKPLKVDVDLVMVNVSVSDSEDHPLTDLNPENFQIFEDNKAQTLSNFGYVDIPVERGQQPLFTTRIVEPDVQSN